MAIGWSIAALSAAATVNGAVAASADQVYIVGNYPVQATAANAVTAKRTAIADGRKAAFRSLLKRIVPVTAYQRIKPLKLLDPRQFIKSVAVKSERSSGTRYIASLDYAFSAKAVRAELTRRTVPYVDQQAAETIVVAIYNAPARGTAGLTREMSLSQGRQLWSTVWSDLDLGNSVTPLKLRRPSKHLQPDVIRQIAGGDMSAMRILAGEYQNDRVVLAIAEPDLGAKRLNVVVAGGDAVGTFSLKRRYRLDPTDFAYALELAAVISLGTIEGRWKAVRSAPSPGSAPDGAALLDVQIWVEFTSLAEWRRRQQELEQLPGVEGFQTGGLSAEGASVQLRYPGGGERLSSVLASRGFRLQAYNGTWILK